MPSRSASTHTEPLPVRQVSIGRPWRWLALGWRDFVSAPGIGLLHGAFVALGGWAVLWASAFYWWLAPGAFSGFVLLGPILATGLYEVSRLRNRGEDPDLGAAITAWRRGTRPLVGMGILLAVLGTLWVLASALLFTLFVDTPLHGPVAFVRYAAAGQGNLLFTLWAILGGLGVAIVFALTAVSPPLLLGREVGLRRALLTSVRAVGQNPRHEGREVGSLLEAVDRRDVRVVEGREDFRFALKAREAVRIAGHRDWQDLDRHRPFQVRVGGLLHLAHSACPERAQDFIWTDAGTGLEAHMKSLRRVEGPAPVGAVMSQARRRVPGFRANRRGV